jgi:two-component system cell cycle response regulator CpdR
MARILVAEDEQTVRELVQRALTQDGHEVEVAVDGALALTVARDFPKLGIVLMTGYAGERDRALGIDELVQDIVLKPFSLSDLKQRLRHALAARAETLASA